MNSLQGLAVVSILVGVCAIVYAISLPAPLPEHCTWTECSEADGTFLIYTKMLIIIVGLVFIATGMGIGMKDEARRAAKYKEQRK